MSTSRISWEASSKSQPTGGSPTGPTQSISSKRTSSPPRSTASSTATTWRSGPTRRWTPRSARSAPPVLRPGFRRSSTRSAAKCRCFPSSTVPASWCSPPAYTGSSRPSSPTCRSERPTWPGRRRAPAAATMDVVPESGPEILTGLVERVTFHSDESGFCVLRVAVRGHRDLCTVVGTLPAVSEGEWLSATGQWTIDAKHGQQFRAEQIRTSAPDTADGIERYLASGLIRGVGPALAARLVVAFGREVFSVIEAAPKRLREVDGIGPTRQKAIAEAFRSQKVVREIMVFLHSHGVSSARAYRIF